MSVRSYGNSSGDSTSANVLTITVIIGSALLLLAALAGPFPGAAQPVPQVTKQAQEQVVVKAPHRVS
jgi:hypothetical protein